MTRAIMGRVDGYLELEQLRARTAGSRPPQNLHMPGFPGGAFDAAVRFRWRERQCETATNGVWMHLEMRADTSLCFAVVRRAP